MQTSARAEEPTPTPDERREVARQLRAQRPPLSFREIGERLGISAQAAHRLLNPIIPPPPLDKPKRYRCERCGARFESRAKRGPARCRKCGSYEWRSKP